MVERDVAQYADVHALVYGRGDPALGCPVTRGDACALPFRANSFDYVFSNAVIEHVGGPDRGRMMLAESRRVARKGAFHTTPNRWFPVETHTQVPLLHWLPRRWQRRAFAIVGKHHWSPEAYWLFSARGLQELDPLFEVERATFATLVASWRPAPAAMTQTVPAT
ncbi:class I SAM-dependent methyltransferase [Modestobacter sp. VKM Ac-2981]|uniref:class I SAM-dependent methyltransferase n=1 Tax=unclassified Modestobacter TaxID=2643866 RepID=UPI003FA5D20B